MKRERSKKRNKSTKKPRQKSKKNRYMGIPEYAFYTVLNTAVNLDQGTAAAAIGVSLITLFNELDSNRIHSRYIDEWMRNGKRISIFKGYDHKHLKYLKEELQIVAIGSHTLYQRWARGHGILVLSVFGEREELDDAFGDLSYLR